MAETESGALSGAAQGAVAGAVVGGPIGAVIGGVVGAIGGVLGGGAAKRARIYANRASKTRRTLDFMEAAVQRRDLVRQARMARAESLAAITAGGEGGLMSSAPMGALSSISSQTGQNLRYFDARIRDFVQMQFWADKAGKKTAQAQNIMGTMGAVFDAVKGMQGIFGQPTPSQAESPTPSQAESPGAYSPGYGGTGPTLEGP